MSKDDRCVEGAEGALGSTEKEHIAVVLSNGFMVEGYADEDFMACDWLKIAHACEVKGIAPGYSVGAIQSSVLKDKCSRYSIPAGVFVPKDQVMMVLPIFEW